MKLKDVFEAIDLCQKFVVEIILPEQYWRAVGTAPKTARLFPRNQYFASLASITGTQQEQLADMNVNAIRMEKFYLQGTEHSVMRIILDEKQQSECNCIAG